MNAKTPTTKSSSDDQAKQRLDWYSGLVLQGIVTKQGAPATENAREEVALWSLRMAEAMIRTLDRVHR